MSRVDNLYTSPNDNLVDIKNLQINTNLPIIERYENIMNKIKDPYCFKCGKITVEAQYSNNDETLENVITDFFVNFNRLK